MVFQHPFRDVKTVSKSIRLVLKKIPEFVPIPRNKPGCQGSCFSMLFNFQGPFPLLRAELYLSTFPEVCQQQVSVFVTVKGRALRPFRDSFAIIPRPLPFVNSLFANFLSFRQNFFGFSRKRLFSHNQRLSRWFGLSPI